MIKRDRLEEIGKQIVDAVFQVHSTLGPGLLESAYEACLMAELQSRNISAYNQIRLPIVYKGKEIDAGYRLDILVEDEIIIELKAVDTLQPVHHAQLLSYLKLSDKRLGYLINFNVPLIKKGIIRIVNKL
jgi:GxxExxY protein